MLAWTILFAVVLKAQTVYNDLPSQNFFNLTVTYDGRIEAKLRGGDYYGEGDPYLDVYRNFIEINSDTGTLLVAFAVAELFFNDDSHIMTVAIPSGATVTNPPLDATFPKPHWFNDNMVLWYDQKKKAFVLLFQEGCYSCLEDYGYTDWMTNHDYDALNQSIFKTLSFDDGVTWHGKVQLLDGWVLDPHVQYQIIPSLEKDADGYATQVMIPVHHLDETTEDNNYQMLWRTNRDIDPDDGSWQVVNMTNAENTEHFGAHIQTSIVRPSGDANLVAFLRDRYGHWIHRTTSIDDGRTWSVQLPTPLGNPDLMSQAVALHNGKIMLFHNPQQSYGSWPSADRDDNSHMLAVSISANAGLSWTHERILEYANDGKSLYPVAVQDPTCDNIYLAWSTETNEQGPGLDCQAITNTGGTELSYDACVNKSVTLDFIKFTVIHESWVINHHSWALDYEGCVWEIAQELKDQIEEMKESYVDGLNGLRLVNIPTSIFSSVRLTINKNTMSNIVIGLTITLASLLCWSAVICKNHMSKSTTHFRKISFTQL